MMSRLLYWLTDRLPCRIISDDGKPYLERYYLFTLLGVRFYIHRFVGSDPARGLHDHPWPWAGSVVLSGWYLEEIRGTEAAAITRILAEMNGTTGVIRRRVRWLNWLTGDRFHRVVLPPGRSECWTLFFHRAAYTKPWGFLRSLSDDTALIWVPHNYPRNGTGNSHGEWWNEVPIGKLETRRMPK